MSSRVSAFNSPRSDSGEAHFCAKGVTAEPELRKRMENVQPYMRHIEEN
jgi:hypothetical protein